MDADISTQGQKHVTLSETLNDELVLNTKLNLV